MSETHHEEATFAFQKDSPEQSRAAFSWLQHPTKTHPSFGDIALGRLERLGMDDLTMHEVAERLQRLDTEIRLATQLYLAGFDRKGILKAVSSKALIAAISQNEKLEPAKSPKRTSVNRQRVSRRQASIPASIEADNDTVSSVEDDKPNISELESAQMLDVEGSYLQKIGSHDLLSAEQEVELAKTIEAGLYAEKILSGDVQPQTETSRNAFETEPHLLEELVELGKQAQERFVLSNLRLTVSIAKKYVYQVRSMRLGDVVQEGNFGLMHAVEMFDYAKGFKFSTYATWWIRQAITRSVGEKDREVRLPIHMLEKINKMERVEREFIRQYDRTPTNDELSAALDIPTKTIHQMREIVRTTQSLIHLNKSIDSDGTFELGDLIKDTTELSIQDQVFSSDEINTQLVRIMRDLLSGREFDVVVRRHGLFGQKKETLDLIGKTWGITKEWVRQIERQAMTKLKSPKDGVPNYFSREDIV